MAGLKQKLKEDRATRDAARNLVTSDVSYITSDVEDQGVGERAVDAGGDYVRIMTDGAIDLIKENRGKVSGGAALAVAGIVAWFFRKPIMEVIDGFMEDAGENPASGDMEPGDADSIKATD